MYMLVGWACTFCFIWSKLPWRYSLLHMCH